MSGTLTVGIATRDRPEALERCLASLASLAGLAAEVIVVDDGSTPPARHRAHAGEGPPVRFIQHPESRGVAESRNVIAREAATPWVLNLDDDAFVLTRGAIERAVRVLERDPEVAAVALPQADMEGRPYPPAAQPCAAGYAAYLPSFVGYGFLMRRAAFLEVGGFRARLGIHGEEKELSLRLLDRGWRVVYLPDACVGHVAAHAGRDARRYLHQTVRNTTLGALYDEPFPLVLGGVALRLYRYYPMRRGWGIDDPGGLGVLLRGLARELPAVLRERAPVRWSTIRRWRALTRATPEPYREP